MIPGRRDLLLFAAALAIRVAHILIVRSGPLFRYLLIDSEFYDSVGARIAGGAGFPEGVFFMNVLYGAFLGAVYSVFGAPETGRLVVLLIQAVLGAASCVLLARIGDALGRSRAGTGAAIALAVYGPAIFYDGALLTPSLVLFLTTAWVLGAIVVRAAPGRWAALALGAITGVLVLGRANNALLLPLYAAVLLQRGRAAVVPTVLLAAGAAAVVAPVTIRNWQVSGELVPVTANGGMALWAGNHENATGIYSAPGFLSNPVPESEAEDYRVEASRRAGRELTLAESSRYWQGATLERWARDPGASARLALRKLALFGNATESQTNLSYYFALDWSIVLAVFRVHLGWVLPFAIVGLALAWRELLVPAVPIAVSLVTCLLFYVSSEYRHPVVPCVLLFAAVGAERAYAILRGGGRPIGKIAVAATILAGFVFANYEDPFLARLQSRRVDYLNFGTLAFQNGNLEESESFLRRSISIDPAFAPSRRKLSEVLAGQGRVREAGEGRRADVLEGRSIDTADLGLERANDLFQAGRWEEALSVFVELAGQADEARALALNNAGLCSMRLARHTEAESLFLAAVEEDSLYASPRIHLGRLALAIGDTATARGRAEEALELAPQDGRAQRLLVRAIGRDAVD